MAEKPILYQTPLSPAVRTVLLVADAIGLELELRYLCYVFMIDITFVTLLSSTIFALFVNRTTIA